MGEVKKMAGIFDSLGGMMGGFANINWLSVLIWTLFFIVFGFINVM